MALGPLGQIHISVSDIDTSVAFYRDVLGIPLLFQVPEMPMAFFASGDVRLYLGVPENPEFRSKVVLYFTVSDIDAEYERSGSALALVHRRAPCGPPRRQWRALDDVHPRPRIEHWIGLMQQRGRPHAVHANRQ